MLKYLGGSKEEPNSDKEIKSTDTLEKAEAGGLSSQELDEVEEQGEPEPSQDITPVMASEGENHQVMVLKQKNKKLNY